jgi:spermidine synthase
MEETTAKISLTPVTTLLIILLEGFVTIAVEMLTIRQLITVVGNSVIITSLIIGIFLLFLALGYYRGGHYRDNYSSILKRNFVIASLLLGVGLSYTFVQLFFYFLFTQFHLFGLIALTIYLLLITAPLVYLLGQTVPITTNLFRYEHHVGSISGKVLALSTVGSFLGSILSTLVLMNFFGVAWTVYLNFFLVLFLIGLLVKLPKDTFLIVGLTVAAIIIYLLNITMEHRLFVATNNYGDYQINANIYYPPTKSIGNLLTINNSASSFLSLDRKGFPYIEEIKQILFQDLGYRNKDILVLGAGGFSLSAESNYTNRFLYVDIDGSLPQIARQGFIDTINGRFVHDDARTFLRNTTQKFDAIVSDVYSSRYTIPFHLVTQEYFKSVRSVLKPNGIAIFNIIANPMMRNNYSKRIDNTIRSVFKNCMIFAIPYRNGPANILYVCPRENNIDQTIYTDNKNASMIDVYQNR